MKNKEYLNILGGLRTLDNIYKSNVSVEELLVVKNFLLLLRKKGLLGRIDFNLHIEDCKLSIQESINKCNREDLKDLYNNHLKSIINSVRKTYLDSLYSFYEKTSESFIDNYAEDFFDTEIQNVINSKGQLQMDALQPKKLTELINYFCDFSNVKDYYNPFAGLASLALNLPKHINYHGEELQEKIWILARLRMILHDCPEKFKFNNTNSIENWENSTELRYDFIGFNPPLNLKLKKSDLSNLSSDYAYTGNANSLIISKCFDQLKENGKMAMVMSSGFLFSNNKKDEELKKELIDHGHVEKIIALPERIFNFTSIAINLIVLSKKSKTNGEIEFIDASEKYKKDDRVNVLDDVEIYRLLSDEDDQLKRLVSIEEVSKNGYNLSVNRYVFEDPTLSSFEKHNLVPLKELVNEIPGKKIKPDENIKIVKVGDLANNSLETIKSFDDVEVKIPKYKIKLIENNSLLLTTAWKSLKPTIYKKEKENIYYDPRLIFACKVDEFKIDIDYLVLELQKDYIQKQLEQRSVGTSISRIKSDDLLEIEVVVPDHETQKKRKFEFKESLLLEHQRKFENLKKQLGVDVADENSFLRHKISGTLKNIRGSYNKLKDIIDNQIHKDLPEVYEYKVNPKLNTTLKDYLYRLDRDIQSVHRAVRKVGVELKLEDIKLETLNFIKFIKDYVEEVSNRSDNNFEIIIDIDKDALRDSNIKEISFRGDKVLLHQVFDNIIENAERHAFSEKKQNNKIKVELLYDFEDLEVQLDFTNTGKPLPEDYSFEAFTRKGSTSGTNGGDGIGGWFIYEAMKLHNGEFGFTDETGPEGILDEDCATTIELTFPIEIKI